MKASQYFRVTAIVVAMLGAGGAVADELPPVAEPMQPRDQMQERMRSMTPEERQLMRETSVDGRARLENRQAATGEGMRRGGGGGYGQGYESRRGGGGDGGGGGRGMGGGRHR